MSNDTKKAGLREAFGADTIEQYMRDQVRDKLRVIIEEEVALAIVYRVTVEWRDAFGEPQKPAVLCAMLDDFTLPITNERQLTASVCPKGFTVSTK